MSSGSTAYTFTGLTTTQKTAQSVASISTESTVYVSNLNLKDEWVQISNKGSSPVSLNG